MAAANFVEAIATCFFVGLFTCVGLVCLLVSYAFIRYKNYRRKLFLAADRFNCESCGKNLGRASVNLADETWSTYFAQLVRNNPGLRYRIRMLRTFHAICAQCGETYFFDEAGRRFIKSELPAHLALTQVLKRFM